MPKSTPGDKSSTLCSWTSSSGPSPLGLLQLPDRCGRHDLQGMRGPVGCPQRHGLLTSLLLSLNHFPKDELHSLAPIPSQPLTGTKGIFIHAASWLGGIAWRLKTSARPHLRKGVAGRACEHVASLISVIAHNPVGSLPSRGCSRGNCGSRCYTLPKVAVDKWKTDPPL